MDSRYVGAKRRLAVGAAAVGFCAGTGTSLLLGDPRRDAVLFGAALAAGFAIAVVLFVREAE